jgi:5-methylcytosine-specific restriction endonuclease McrA
VSLGGSSHPSNLQLLCEHCNRTKWAKHPIAWAQENGRLL